MSEYMRKQVEDTIKKMVETDDTTSSVANLEALRDYVAQNIWGMSLTEAHEQRICIACRKNVDDIDMNALDQQEWERSGMCPPCWDNFCEKLEEE